MLIKAIVAVLLAVSYAQTTITTDVMEDSIERLIAMGEKKNVMAIRKLEAEISPGIKRFREEEKKWKKMPKDHATSLAQTWKMEWENNISPKMDQLILSSMVCEEIYGDNPDCETEFSWNSDYETRAQMKTKEWQKEFAWYVTEIVNEIISEGPNRRADL